MTVDRRHLEKTLQGIGLTKEQAGRAVRRVLSEMHSVLSAGRTVALRSFGTLLFKEHRRGRMWNPRSRSSCRINGVRLLRFRAAESFRRRIKS